jgi:putative PIN family toxin of toxin-antitoxin system
MRVFLDTNVLASATATRGLCADVMREVIASHDLVISESFMRELKDVLKQKLGASQDIIHDVERVLRQDSILAVPSTLPNVRLKHKDDLIILASALAGGAELFITGDKELLRLRRIGSLRIVSPRQFWERLKSKP